MQFFIILMLFSGVVNGKAYKCEVNGKTTYQQSPCVDGGEEVKLVDDLSYSDRKAAENRISQNQKHMVEKRKADYEAWDRRKKEDLDYYNLRANQAAAIGENRQANEMRRQRRAIEEQNRILNER